MKRIVSRMLMVMMAFALFTGSSFAMQSVGEGTESYCAFERTAKQTDKGTSSVIKKRVSKKTVIVFSEKWSGNVFKLAKDKGL